MTPEEYKAIREVVEFRGVSLDQFLRGAGLLKCHERVDEHGQVYEPFQLEMPYEVALRMWQEPAVLTWQDWAIKELVNRQIDKMGLK